MAQAQQHLVQVSVQLVAKALKNKDALIEAEETIEALSHGDVSALVAQGMEEHKTGFGFEIYITIKSKKIPYWSSSITWWLPCHTQSLLPNALHVNAQILKQKN